MNSFILAFSVVCPLFLMMSLGCFLRHIGLFNDTFLQQLNKLCFQIFLPLLLFLNVYESDFSSAFRPKLVLYAMVCILALFALLLFFVPKFVPENRRRGVMVQAILRSNFVLFGLPLVNSLFGERQTGITAILIAFVVPLFNVLCVVALEFFKGTRTNWRSILKGILTNPLIIGAAAAFFCIFTGLRLPLVLEKTVRDIAKIATPLSLIVLGGSFAFSRLKHNLKALLCAVGGRLVVVPFVFLTLAIMLGFRGEALCALFSLFASPTAVSSFTMAQQMGADDELAGQIVVIGSVSAIITIFFWISILNQTGFLAL
ncbi:MAG: AEC family transporter [Ruthenibacterium sp.]